MGAPGISGRYTEKWHNVIVRPGHIIWFCIRVRGGVLRIFGKPFFGLLQNFLISLLSFLALFGIQCRKCLSQPFVAVRLIAVVTQHNLGIYALCKVAACFPGPFLLVVDARIQLQNRIVLIIRKGGCLRHSRYECRRKDCCENLFFHDHVLLSQ